VQVAPGRTRLRSKWVELPFAFSLSKKGTRVGADRGADPGADVAAEDVCPELVGDELAAAEVDGGLAVEFELEPAQPATDSSATIPTAITRQALYTWSPTNSRRPTRRHGRSTVNDSRRKTS
jgi:hypothetical protein